MTDTAAHEHQARIDHATWTAQRKREAAAVTGEGGRMNDTAKLAATILPDDEVCACLSETGERKIRLYERCQRCGAFMEADYLSEELHALEQRNERLVEALRFYAEGDNWTQMTSWGGRIFDEESDVINDYGKRARAALAAGSTGGTA